MLVLVAIDIISLRDEIAAAAIGAVLIFSSILLLIIAAARVVFHRREAPAAQVFDRIFGLFLVAASLGAVAFAGTIHEQRFTRTINPHNPDMLVRIVRQVETAVTNVKP